MTDEHTPADATPEPEPVPVEPIAIADESDLAVAEPTRRRFAALRSAHAVAALGILLAGIGILAMGVAPLIDHGDRHHGDRRGDRQGQQMQDGGDMRGPGGGGH